MEPITQVSVNARQISGAGLEGRPILAVLVKRTYTIQRDGRCVPADEQLPLHLEPEADPDNPDLLAHDLDIFPIKLATDVVIKGHAYTPPGRRSLEAAVQVGRHRKTVLVTGDRVCGLSPTGKITISEAVPWEQIPLRYDRAYGGKDDVAEARRGGNPFEELRKYIPMNFDLSQASPFFYPRNPCGVGYLIEPTAEAVERLRLPNLEDPEDRLTPERLVVGSEVRWPPMPLPQAFDWVHHTWFPRLAYFGFLPPHDPLDPPVAEVVRGYAPADLMKLEHYTEKFNFRFTNGASLGLQLPYLEGTEECQLIHLHPHHSRTTFRLPGERPKIWTDGRKGKLNETESVLHTVVIEPDEGRVSLVWRGSAPALRPYMDQELEGMPLKVEWP